MVTNGIVSPSRQLFVVSSSSDDSIFSSHYSKCVIFAKRMSNSEDIELFNNKVPEYGYSFIPKIFENSLSFYESVECDNR